MFVWSVKTTGKQLCAALCTVALCMAVLAVALFVPEPPASVVAAPADTPEKQQTFLRSLGYTAGEAPLSIEEVKLPENPRDAAFVAYNSLQFEAGFNLGLYLGRTVKCYAWSVKADDGNAAIAHLYVYKDKIVGGDLTDSATGNQRALTRITREE